MTGGFATGKTTVARMFRHLGAEVIDCDRIAHEALAKGTPTYRQIAKGLYHHRVLNRSGAIDRKKLARAVFADARARKKLEGIVHPYVFREIARRLRENTRPMVVLEVPLLFETGFDKKVDWVVVVAAPRGVQIARARRKFHETSSEIRSRLRAQLPLSYKVGRADFIIDNGGSLTQTARQVQDLWSRLQILSRRDRISRKS